MSVFRTILSTCMVLILYALRVRGVGSFRFLQFANPSRNWNNKNDIVRIRYLWFLAFSRKIKIKCVSVMLFTHQQYVRRHDGHYN